MSPEQQTAVQIFTETAALYAAVILSLLAIAAWALDRWWSK